MQPINIILAVYQPEHLGLIGPLYENLIDLGHVTMTIATSPEYERVVKPMIGNGNSKVSVSGVLLSPEQDQQFMQFAADPVRHDVANLWAWIRAIKILEFGTPFVCLDLASLVFRPFQESWSLVRPSPFTLAMAQRMGENGRLQFIPKMIYGNSNQICRTVLDLWTREILRQLGRSDRQAIQSTYGSILGASYALLKSQMDESGGGMLSVIPQSWAIEKPPPIAESGVLLFPRDPNKGLDGYDWFPVLRTYARYKERAEKAV